MKMFYARLLQEANPHRPYAKRHFPGDGKFFVPTFYLCLAKDLDAVSQLFQRNFQVAGGCNCDGVSDSFLVLPNNL